MDPATHPGGSPYGSPCGSPNVPNSSETARATQLYESSRKLVSTHPTTDKLAQAIFHSLNQMEIYQFDNTPHLSNPYKVGEVKKFINGTFDILHGVPHLVYMFLINDNNFKLFHKHQTKTYEVRQELKEVDNYNEGNDGYVVFLSNRVSYKFQVTEFTPNKERNKVKFYYYCPFLKQSIESKEAPFHHEAQLQASSSTCGLHAINAYIGCRYLSPDKFAKYIEHWSTFSEESNSGIDPAILKVVLEKIAKKGKISSVNCIPKLIQCSTKATELGIDFSECERGLLDDFNCIDRFILGVTKSEAHFLAFRKDKKGWWWKVDSKLSKQESFADAQELVEAIKTTYDGDLLHFIIPDRNQKVTRSSENLNAL